jgi:hypothetical protein
MSNTIQPGDLVRFNFELTPAQHCYVIDSVFSNVLQQLVVKQGQKNIEESVNHIICPEYAVFLYLGLERVKATQTAKTKRYTAALLYHNNIWLYGFTFQTHAAYRIFLEKTFKRVQ